MDRGRGADGIQGASASRRRRRSGAVAGAVFALTCLAAGCGGSDDNATARSATAGNGASKGVVSADACQGASLSFIGLAGEEGKKELAAFRKTRNTKLQVTSTADWGQIIGAIKVGQPYDLNTIPVLEAQRMIKAGVVQPIDTSRLANWKDIVPALRDSPALRGPGGKVYGVPILWGDGPYVYAPDRVPTPPTSIAELLKPEWKGKFTMFDDPGLAFYMVAQSMGFTGAPNLTMAQFGQVKAKAKALVKNAAAFQASYQDATDRLVAGDIDLAIGGWEAMLGFGQDKGKKLEYKFFKESKGGGYWDGLAIPKGAKNAECALAYIDQLIAPKVNARLATNLTSGAANGKSVPFLGKAATAYDYKSVQNPTGGIEFVAFYPPEKAQSGYASLKDWQDAWKAIKAG